MLVAWSSSRAALQSRHEYALSQLGTHPNMTIDVARALNNNKYTTKLRCFTGAGSEIVLNKHEVTPLITPREESFKNVVEQTASSSIPSSIKAHGQLYLYYTNTSMCRP